MHAYARGINKMSIFKDVQDYKTYLYLLKKYLTPDFKEKKLIGNKIMKVPVNSVSSEVELFAYCLMSNHFHLLLRDVTGNGITGLFRRVLVNYTYYYNEKYNRTGNLLQGSYRGVTIQDESQLITTAVYIHYNPIKHLVSQSYLSYPYSSIYYYLRNKGTKWLHLEKSVVSKVNFRKLDLYYDSADSWGELL